MDRTPFRFCPQCHAKFPYTDPHSVCNLCLSRPQRRELQGVPIFPIQKDLAGSESKTARDVIEVSGTNPRYLRSKLSVYHSCFFRKNPANRLNASNSDTKLV
ncbi:hypothetical protein NDU88_004302 [Pleurodeles waltl]|uniref:Uncharacterized protein n=1 Tax=Pleurodeles waltl TaxID=8319 RepID=A0AAV7TTQ0_PLEWA|nr:hypothetical protein NDU88_004302 [Pleurodeles waltl]